MPDDAFQLPDNFGSAGDPVDGNPFPTEDPRHDVWAEATRTAEMEIAELNLRSMARVTPPAAFIKSPVHPDEWLIGPALAKFDIWAKRGVHVVWSDRELTLFDKWLVSFANDWLTELQSFFERHPAPFSAEIFLKRARNAFAIRVQQWRLEARRYRESQRAAATEGEPAVTPELKRQRKLVVAKHRRDRDLTAAGFAQCIGISESAIRGIVNEDKTRFSEVTQRRLLEALKITREDWYRDLRIS